MTKRKNKPYPTEFKQEAIALVVEKNHSISQAVSSLGITDKILYNWGLIMTTKRKHRDAVADNLLNMNFNPVGLIKFGLAMLAI